MRASCGPGVQARGGLLLRAALSGQTSRPTAHRLCGHVSNKPKALSLTGGCPPRPHGHNTLALGHPAFASQNPRVPAPSDQQNILPFPVLFRGRARVSRAHRTDQFRPTSSPSWTNTPSVLSLPTTSSPLSRLLPSLPLSFPWEDSRTVPTPLPGTRGYPLPFPSCWDSHLFSPFPSRLMGQYPAFSRMALA